MRRRAKLVLAAILALLAAGVSAQTARSLPTYDAASMRERFATDPTEVRAASLPYLAEDARVSRKERLDAARIVSLTYAVQGDYQRGLTYAQLQYDLALADHDKKSMAGALNNIAAMNNSLGRFEEAVTAFRRAARLAKETKQANVLVSALGNLSNLFLNTQNYQQALDFSLEAEAVARREGSEPFPAVAYIGRAEAYHFLGRAKEAASAVRLAEAGLPQEDLARQAALALVKARMAQLAGNSPDARRLAKRCIDLIASAGADPMQGIECRAISAREALQRDNLAIARGEITSAKAILDGAKNGADLAAVSDALAIAELERDLAIKEGKGDALGPLLTRIDTLRTVLANARENSGIALAAADLEKEGKDLSIALLEARNANLALSNARQRTLIAAIAVISLTVLGTAIALWLAYRRRVLLSTQLHDVIGQREFLLGDMRHRAKNNLQLIVSLLNIQERDQKQAGAQGQSLGEVNEDLRRRIRAMGHIYQFLYESSAATDLVAVKPLLADLSCAVATSFGEDAILRLKLDLADATLTSDRAQALGLLVAELLANAFKHTPTGDVCVQLTHGSADMALLLKVSDNGTGFDIDRQAVPGSGLRLVEDFADQLRASLECHSSGSGTTWTAAFRADGPPS